MFVKKLGFLLLSTSLLTACGGSDSDDTPLPDVPPPVTGTPDPTEYNLQVQGVVAYLGALAGADVCADLNMDQECGSDEPFSTTDNDGQYQIDWTSTTVAPTYYLIANWTDSNSSSPAQPQLLSSRFKNEKLKPTSAVTSASNAAQGQSTLSTVITNGDGQLIAMSAHDGAINALTHLEFQRYEQMLAQELSTDKIQALRLQLSIILDALYAPLTGKAYQVTAESSSSDEFVNTYSSHQHIAALIGDRLMATLAIDDVMAASRASITYLALQSDMTISEYLASDPIDVRFIVNDTLIAQGYIVTPFDNKIMADVDWDIIDTGIFSNETGAHQFTVAPLDTLNSFILDYGDPTHKVVGYMSDNTLQGKNVNLGQMQFPVTTCWNADLEKWINPDRTDQGYSPAPKKIVNNSRTVGYTGTSEIITTQVEKYYSNSDTWRSILNAQPAQLKLNELQWPEYVYRYHMKLSGDVMCQLESNFNISDMPNPSIELLTTFDVAELVWPGFYPDILIVDDEKRQLLVEHTTGTYATFVWEIVVSPNGSPLLRVNEHHEPVAGKTVSAFKEYLSENGKFYEVEIIKADLFNDMNDYFLITYDGETDNFSQQFFEHLSALLPTYE